MRYLVCICIFLFLKLFAGFDYERESNKIIKKVLSEVKPFGIYPLGIGGGGCSEINLVSIHLECRKKLSIENARNLYFTILFRIIDAYNSNNQIRPYLHNFPFDRNNLELNICFEGYDGSEGDVASMMIANDYVFYDGFDLANGNYFNIYRENVSTAISLFKNQNIKDDF